MTFLRKTLMLAYLIALVLGICASWFLSPTEAKARRSAGYEGICVKPDTSYSYCDDWGSLACVLQTVC